MRLLTNRATPRSRPSADTTQPATFNGRSTTGEESNRPETTEERRLAEARERTAHWKRWGPYLSDRSWGTVREDYSADGSAWEYLPHDHARSRTYRWNEDGIAGISDRHQLICFAPAFWNGRDPILKERLFGLTGSEGNHGEDVKECYYYLDSTPTHSYMRFLYKYPQAEFPYGRLVEENRRRGKDDPEFELVDTGVFDEDRYFDVFVEYAKAGVEDLLIRITAVNRGPEASTLHLLPTAWFRNTWCWADEGPKPRVTLASQTSEGTAFHLWHPHYGERWLVAGGVLKPLFTENETNTERLFGAPNDSPYVKDGIHECVVHGRADRVNPEQSGTKAAAHYQRTLQPGEEWELRRRLTDQAPDGAVSARLGAEWERTFAERRQEADEFYATVIPSHLSPDGRSVMRQAFAGLLWSKQHYHYVVRHWLTGDPAQPSPPPQREDGRNCSWSHLHNTDVISMPDVWEYPWYASWDLAFHTIPLALVDPDFAKEQLILLTREWYMHPNGQLPAYEWAFEDVNPPVHAAVPLRAVGPL